MKRLTGSIYAHLTLVLLIALSASFATMYLLFLSHLEQSRNSHFAHELAPQVRLVEALLQHIAPADLPDIEGIRVAPQPSPSPSREITESERQQLTILQESLAGQLQRTVEITAATDATPGLWITLRTTPSQWAFIPTPERHRPPGYALEQALLVGFSIFFAGGMLLLWRIQRPLKRLSNALNRVGHGEQLEPLPVSGAGEIRTLTQHYTERHHTPQPKQRWRQ